MTKEFLLDAIGDAKGSYIWEAQQLRSGETASAGRKQRISPRKLWLLAAVIGLLVLSITACAVVYARIHMNVVQHNSVTEPPNSDEAHAPQSAAVDVLTACYPQALPEGYHILSGTPLNHTSRNICYQNDRGNTIHFCISTEQDYSQEVLTPPVEEERLEISSQEATLRISGAGGRQLTWQNTSDGYYAALITEDSQVDLAAMAQSVGPGEALPLSFLYHRGQLWDAWYPQQLPEGYRCTNVNPAADGEQSIQFTNDSSGYVDYHISTVRDYLSMITDPPHDSVQWEDLTVAGQPAKLMTLESGQRVLFWENEAEGFYAMLETQDGTVDLTAMAESVGPGDPLEFSSSWLGPDYTIEMDQEGSGYVQWEPVYPQALPEGYFVSFVSDPAYGEQSIRYENGEDGWIYYTLYFRLGQWGRQFDGMGQPEQVDINGHVGYRSGNSLVWTDEARGFGFALSADEGVDVLAVAESVGPGPELRPTNADKTEKALQQLGDYRITALPEGMVEDGLTGCPLEDGGGWYSYVRRWYISTKTNAQIYFEYESYITDPGDCPTVEELLDMFIREGGNPVRMVTINGCSGASLEDDSGACVVWLIGEPAKGTMFRLLSSDFSAGELLKLAESVQKEAF